MCDFFISWLVSCVLLCSVYFLYCVVPCVRFDNDDDNNNNCNWP